MNALTVTGLTKRYPAFALDGLSFALGQGRIMGLIGKNGAGKTTALKCMLGLVAPDGGEVAMLGMPFAGNGLAIKQRLGVVLGGIDFYQHKKLRDITSVTRRFYQDWDGDAYGRYLDLFELDPGKRVNQLSQGMKVKYLIALALSHRARLLILDEPTTGLDPVSRDDLLELFGHIVKDGRKSILFSTHITSDLDRCADDITYIKEGTLLHTAPKAQFVSHFDSLRKGGEGPLTLEEIMLRTERNDRYAKAAL